ncbi:MAG: glycosyltransferase, partial [Candidatus Omnitrophica bacterium]|nr:glycosyltransferase [Candidatus Omnitrophota bacterium]
MVTKLELGGAQKQLLSLIAHLNKERFHLFLFVAQEGLLLSEALSIKGITIIKSRCLERAINPIKDLLALIEIYWFIKKNNIEVVHTHSSKAGILGRLAARLARIKVIIHTVHGWSFNDCQPALVRRFFI